jgi:hypothetical protein
MATIVKEKAAPEKKVKTFDLSTQVLSSLGTPPDLYKVESKHLFGNIYRVNVRVKNTSNNLVTVTNIPHSYFLTTNDNGEIIGGDEIAKVYC